MSLHVQCRFFVEIVERFVKFAWQYTSGTLFIQSQDLMQIAETLMECIQGRNQAITILGIPDFVHMIQGKGTVRNILIFFDTFLILPLNLFISKVFVNSLPLTPEVPWSLYICLLRQLLGVSK